ncbi:hypothetical protein [Halobacteriovorax sp. DPLXC-1]|uniref:hypothetical protein n=1 Tax=unclassified Halobacteriovorax TaxID=2639665 RepID=UPI002FEE6DDE
MLRYARLTLLIAFFASFLAATIHTHDDSHEISNIHDSCSVCLHGKRISCLDSPDLESTLIVRATDVEVAGPFVTSDEPLFYLDLTSITLRGPPSLIS